MGVRVITFAFLTAVAALQKFKLEYTRTWPVLIESVKKGIILRAATCATSTSRYRTVVVMIAVTH